MKAIIVEEPGKATVQEVPVPKLRPDYIKIKVKAIALNPTDWKHIDRIADKGAKIGCDVAGVVEEVGAEVKKTVKTGDRVFGFVHGGNVSNHEDGGFAEYAVIKDWLFLHLPKALSFEDGASLTLGVGTVGQGLYQSLELPLPGKAGPASSLPLLVYGGSTATGTLAIQFAVLSGLEVITTASPKNHDMLLSLGASKCFDYKDPGCSQQIREYTGDKLRYVFDTITDESSMKICADALSSTTDNGELHYSALLPIKFPRQDVNARTTLLYTMLGEEYVKMGKTSPAKPENYEFGKEFLPLAERLIAEGKIKPHPLQIGTGLDGALEGLDKMRKGEYNAKKLVYTID